MHPQNYATNMKPKKINKILFLNQQNQPQRLQRNNLQQKLFSSYLSSEWVTPK